MKRSLLFRLAIVGGLACGYAPHAAAQADRWHDGRAYTVTGRDEHRSPPSARFGSLVPSAYDARLLLRTHDVESGREEEEADQGHLAERRLASQTAAHGSREKHVLIGALAGGIAGAVFAIADVSSCKASTNGVPCALGASTQLALDVSAGALVGGLIGALLPAGP